jgi:hypothetical protein
MNGRILINLDNVLAHGRNGADFISALFDLADEINASLDLYHCEYIHLDTSDFLAFRLRQTENEGNDEQTA